MHIDRLTEVRHNVRSFLNHIVGYSDIAACDPKLAEIHELHDLFVKIRSCAVDLGKPVNAYFTPGNGPDDSKHLKQRIYGLLYDIIAYVQTTKRNVLVYGEKTRLDDVELILKAANNIVEIFEDEPNVEEAAEKPAEVESSYAHYVEQDAGSRQVKQGRILLVDDDPTNRDLLSRHIERQGHVVCSADNGLSALEMMRKAPFDICIIDVMMPGMNGYQLLERLKADPVLRDTYVIVISALDESFSIAKCIQLGAEDYLPRQYDPVILRARIESCLEKKRLREREAMYIGAVVAAQERLASEMRGAAEYVTSLLPKRVNSGAVKADWQFIPSLSLGGDIFNYHWLDGDARRFAVFVIDVSGHGIASALVSVTIMNILRNRTLVGADFGDPASILAALNASFRMEEQDGLYFSIWYGVYDTETRELRYSSAAMTPALLIGPDGVSDRLSAEGTALGVDSGATYENRSVRVTPGSSLYVFSDGIYEVKRRDGSMLGFEGFAELLARRNEKCRISGDCPSFAESTVNAVRHECGIEDFSDDVSIVVLSFE
jgi:sigma-B regulation protein RsbU (phosphoserine phosphatase)